MPWVAAALGNKDETGGLSHFNDGSLTVAHDAPVGFDRLGEGAGGLGGEGAASRGVDEGFQGAVAAISDGEEVALGLGEDLEDALLDSLGDLGAREAAFEGLGSDEDFHGGIIQCE